MQQWCAIICMQIYLEAGNEQKLLSGRLSYRAEEENFPFMRNASAVIPENDRVVE